MDGVAGSQPVVDPGTLLVLRVWLPDRPGALGAVASRIGAVGADLVGIEIIDRGAGRVVDELTVELPDAELLDLLVSEIHDVDGTDVEDVRELPASAEDLAVEAVRVTVSVQQGSGPSERADRLAAGVLRLLRADWSVVLDPAACEVLATVGRDAPDAAWLTGFVRGMTTDCGSTAEVVDDLAFCALAGGDLVLAVGRARPRLSGRERTLLAAMGELGVGLSPNRASA